MLPCHNCYICGTWGSKEVGFFKSYHTEGRGKAKRATLMGCHKKTTQGVNH